MPLPTGTPTTLPKVKAWADIDDTVDDTVLADVVNAVNELVVGLPVAQRADTGIDGEVVEDWPARIQMGATMLAARVARRRNTPGGVEVAGAFGIAYVRRNDPDVAQLLDLGEYAVPGVG